MYVEISNLYFCTNLELLLLFYLILFYFIFFFFPDSGTMMLRSCDISPSLRKL